MVSILVAVAIAVSSPASPARKGGEAYLYTAQPLHTELMRCHARPLATGGTVQECEVQ